MKRSDLEKIVLESLRDWFKKEKWVRITTSGNIAGPCGTSKNTKNPDRCLPKAKAQSLSKSERASTAKKKKQAGSKGKQFVSNTNKAKVTRESLEEMINSIISEKDDRCTRIAKSKYDSWPSAYASGAVVRCRRGEIWKDLKEEDKPGLSAFSREIAMSKSSTNEGYILQDLEEKYNIKLDLYDNGKYLVLSRIVIPSDKRGLGIGSEVMEAIITYADSNNRPIYLTPSKDLGATSIQRLEKFYKKFGFKNKEKSDFSNKEAMVRYPNTNKKVEEYVNPAKESEVDQKELKRGIEVEMEHTTDSKKAKIIALQHLAEDPRYYSKLDTLNL